MVPFIAVPIVHSAGGWIASTAAGGYIAGTLSTTWIGAFIAGNSVLAGAIGGATAIGAGMAAWASGVFGSAAAAVGISTTPLWIPIAGATAATTATIGAAGYAALRVAMNKINAERVEGGLEPITISELIEEVKTHSKTEQS